MKEFFGFGGYQRSSEGFMSWQHLLFVTILNVAMIVAGIILGKKYKGKAEAEQNKVLIATAILVDGLELFRVVWFCIRSQDPWNWLYNLPLFCAVSS